MEDTVVVRTSREQLEELLNEDVDEVKLEVYEPGLEPTPLSVVEIGMTCDIAGVVREVNSINYFERDDGSEGKVRNIRIQDSTSSIRIALWGDKADMEFELGQPVSVSNVDIQDGWQDDIEASCGWSSNIEKLEEMEIDFVRVQLDEPVVEDGE